jgi:hypothetical protein
VFANRDLTADLALYASLNPFHCCGLLGHGHSPAEAKTLPPVWLYFN